MPSDSGKHPEQESELENQVSAKPIPSDDVDAIATWISVVLTAITAWTSYLGHTAPSIWLGGLTLWCAAIAMIAHVHERNWLGLAWIINHRPKRCYVIAGFILLICTSAVHWRWSAKSTTEAVAEKSERDELRQEIKEIKELTPKTRYVLKPGFGDVPEMPKLPEELQDEVDDAKALVFLGKHVACVNSFPYTVIVQDDEPMLWLEEKDGELLISAKFFNENDEVISDIDRGVLSPQFQKVFRVRELDPPHRLTVLDNQIRPVLDIEFINHNTIRIFGSFFLRNRLKIDFEQNRIVVAGASYEGFMVCKANTDRFAFKITSRGKGVNDIVSHYLHFVGDGTSEIGLRVP